MFIFSVRVCVLWETLYSHEENALYEENACEQTLKLDMGFGHNFTTMWQIVEKPNAQNFPSLGQLYVDLIDKWLKACISGECLTSYIVNVAVVWHWQSTLWTWQWESGQEQKLDSLLQSVRPTATLCFNWKHTHIHTPLYSLPFPFTAYPYKL